MMDNSEGDSLTWQWLKKEKEFESMNLWGGTVHKNFNKFKQ